MTSHVREGETVLRPDTVSSLVKEPGLGDAGGVCDHLGLPPGHGAGGGGGQEAVQGRHGLGPGLTRTLNTTSLRSALIAAAGEIECWMNK